MLRYIYICCLVFIPEWLCRHGLGMQNKKKNSNSNQLAKVAKQKMRERKLRIGVNMKGTLQQKKRKINGRKARAGCVLKRIKDSIVLFPSSHFARLLPVVVRKYQDICCLITCSYGCSRTVAGLRLSYATGKLLRCHPLNKPNRFLPCVRQLLQHNCAAGQSVNRFVSSQ